MLGAVRDSENWADLRYALVETFDIFVGVNGRLAEPFDGGRVQIAMVWHYLVSESGHRCDRFDCPIAISRYYELIRPTDSIVGRRQRIDRLFNKILHADNARRASSVSVEVLRRSPES